MDTREQTWERLQSESFDLLIVGGGITGAGAFRDAARRGLKVAIVEAVDFAFGTSSRSSKLVHGGLRYLENREFSLVFEAVSERRTLMNIAPHLVNPLAFLFPVYEDSRVGFNTIRAGMWLYDALALFRAPKRHITLSVDEVGAQVPPLLREGMKGASLYYDCATDDARLTLETVLDGVDGGGAAINYARVTGFLRDENGRISGVRIYDTLPASGRGEIDVKATAVINATGPWTDRTRAMGTGGEARLRPTKGVHMVVRRDRLGVDFAVVHTHPTDSRVMFTIPWGDRTYIGTTDTDYEGDPADVAATAEDIEYLLAAMAHFYPNADLAAEDVIATWAGLRPLIAQEGSTATVSREHEIFVDRDGLITIAGGKLTTYRRMGAEVVSRAMDMMALLGRIPADAVDAATGREPLPGAVGWPEDDDHDKVAAEVLEVCETLAPDTAAHLGNHYGMRGLDVARLARADQRLQAKLADDRPEILAEVDWVVHQELAATVRDVLIRRTQVFFRNLDQGLSAAEAVAGRMAELLGWSDQRRIEEVLSYQEEVARSRRWKSG